MYLKWLSKLSWSIPALSPSSNTSDSTRQLTSGDWNGSDLKWVRRGYESLVIRLEFWVWWANTRSLLDFSAFGCCILFKENRLCVKSWSIFLLSDSKINMQWIFYRKRSPLGCRQLNVMKIKGIFNIYILDMFTQMCFCSHVIHLI